MADKTGLRLQRSWVLQIENLSTAGNFEREIIMTSVINRRRGEIIMTSVINRRRGLLQAETLIFHFLIIWAKRMLHSWMKWSCFILWSGSGTMLHRQAFMKHGFAVWSGTLCHEAHLRCMKRSLTASFFLPLKKGKKMVEDFSNRKTPNAKSAILKNAIKQSAVLHFYWNNYCRYYFDIVWNYDNCPVGLPSAS